MKSSTGAHFVALDHIRALAALFVVTWHFIHAGNGYPVAFNYAPLAPFLSIFDEGHTGVALFMTLSGYLFSKLLDGKNINYFAFLWNRAIRLLPLLVVVIICAGIQTYHGGGSVTAYVVSVAKGVLLPTLPNGGWSITVEIHFYLLLPILLLLFRHSNFLPTIVIVIAIALRIAIHAERGEVQSAAYWTIIGRIDQFTLGMLAYQLRNFFSGRHLVALSTLSLFTFFYWWFDANGGFYNTPSYPSPSPIWIILPTIEGLAYAIGIAWYDNSFIFHDSGVSKFIGRIGAYSYSIYLLHFFVVFRVARYVSTHITNISNFYMACAWAFAFYLMMALVGYFSFRYIEEPFLRLRRHYILQN